MELSVSSPKQSVLSPPECMSDPEEQEISEEDDDDRNHKHRRRETRSQSLERDSSDQVFTGPYRKNNRHFESGNSFTEHERRRPNASSAQRVHFDLNQRIRPNQTFPGDSGPGRGRGRDYGSWNQRDSRFNPVDLSSHMIQVRSMAPSIFGGRGLSGVSTPQNAPWPPFGMLPGVRNGGLDALHTIGLQGTLRPALNSPLNVGISRQRCRDFEERGFCLRGDMCPMEHGINRIVVDDVQSLSQFNLPVSLPGAPLLGAPSKSVPAHVGSSSTFMSTKGVNGKNNKGGMVSDGLGYGDPYTGTVATDFYDPDQPLWSNNAGETSGAIPGVNSQGIDETVAPLDGDNHDGAENECGVRNSRSTSQSVWGRIRGSNTQPNAKDKVDLTLTLSGGLGYEEASGGSSRQGKRVAGETVAKLIDSSSKAPNDDNIRKLTQKAQRTLFVNGIPRESNKKELLLAHFQKFGKVIDIRIPVNSERAFVQFSKREEAEGALKAPDAVMGNRFIKLWWANRDSIPDICLSTGNSGTVAGRGMVTSGGQNQLPIASTSKGNFMSATSKGPILRATVGPPSSDRPKPVAANGPQHQMKLPRGIDDLSKEELEQLRKQLWERQAELQQKRKAFFERFASYNKRVPRSSSGGSKSSQAAVDKGEKADEQDAKRLKVDTSDDLSKAHPNSSSDTVAATTSSNPKLLTDNSKPAQKSVASVPKPSTGTSLQESKILKQRIRPFATTMKNPVVNRYKLDNRTTTIKVVPPLPAGLADVAVLKEHFSSFGEVSNVELEEEGSDASKSTGARITFTKRGAAEKAFLNAQTWRGQVLRFVWVERSSKGNNNPSVSNDASSVEKSSTSDAPKSAPRNVSVSNAKEASVEARDVRPEEDTRLLDLNDRGCDASGKSENKRLLDLNDRGNGASERSESNRLLDLNDPGNVATEKSENNQSNESTESQGAGASQTSVVAMKTGEEESAAGDGR